MSLSRHEPIEWRREARPVPYPEAVAAMERRVAAIRAGSAPEMIWLLEHPPIYTAGTSARAKDLLDPSRFPVYPSGRGGQYTYHGPGQRVAYVMLDLTRRGSDLRDYVRDLETWLIRTLAVFGVTGERRPGRIGIWIARGGSGGTDDPGGETGREDKIAALGIRIRRWVSYHGIALNVAPDLTHYEGIVPCAQRGHGVTSLADLGRTLSMSQVDSALEAAFAEVFGRMPVATVK